MSDVDSLVRNLRILLKADLILAELHLQRIATKSALFMFACVIAAFGAVMLGLAGFFLLQETYGTVLAAAISGGSAVVVALVLALIGAALKPGREAAVAMEVHEAALDAVTLDLKTASGQAQRFATSMASPMQMAAPLIVPLVGYVLKLLRGRGTPAK